MLSVLTAELQRRLQPRQQKLLSRAGEDVTLTVLRVSSEAEAAAVLQVRRTSPNHLLLITGTVSYAAVAAVSKPAESSLSLQTVLLRCLVFQAFPQILLNRLGIRSLAVQTVCRSVLPIPLSGERGGSASTVHLFPLHILTLVCSRAGLPQRVHCQE